MHRFIGALVAGFERRPACLLYVIPVFLILFNTLGPYRTDSLYNYANVALGADGATLPGRPSIDPNVGATSYALGVRAAKDVIAGRWPLWNHYEGLGAPLLGGLQSAALFPPTLLLLLPHGQAIEHALLQALGGFGAFLFFRSFGLGVAAAVTGGLLFEVNGVFAWLRNAIFNPVAFLPWLLYAFEGLRASAIAGEGLARRAPTICLGGVMGALALYAGFPEVTYFYVLLVAAWAVFRLMGLMRPQAAQVLIDGALTAALALALSAPALTAFVAYLREADVAGHVAEGFYGQWAPAGAILQYMLPYVYGPIWTSYDPLVANVWGKTGGYIGFLPLLAALAALFSPGRRGVKLFLAGWIVVALGASHGWPGFYQGFMQLPLAKVAATYRYINTSWIFCCIFLAAILVNDAALLPRAGLRRVLMAAGAVTAVLIGAAIVAAWPLIVRLWTDTPGLRKYGLAALLAAPVLFAAALAATRAGRAFAPAMGALLAAEAAMWFLVPFLSYPRHGHLDGESIAFLRANAGYQRVMLSFGDRAYGLMPNFGSAFGIPSLNYDNVPVPKLTVDYVRERLDPYASVLFLPWAPGLDADQRARRARDVRDRLDRYAAAGVKYVMAGPSFDPRLVEVFKGEAMTIYEIPGTRNYFTAPGCTVTPVSHDLVDTRCEAPSELLRLELFMKGWSADVSGKPADVVLRDGAFQGVALPAGQSRVAFTFRPAGFSAAVAAAGCALLLVLAVAGRQILNSRRPA